VTAPAAQSRPLRAAFGARCPAAPAAAAAPRLLRAPRGCRAGASGDAGRELQPGGHVDVRRGAPRRPLLPVADDGRGQLRRRAGGRGDEWKAAVDELQVRERRRLAVGSTRSARSSSTRARMALQSSPPTRLLVEAGAFFLESLSSSSEAVTLASTIAAARAYVLRTSFSTWAGAGRPAGIGGGVGWGVVGEGGGARRSHRLAVAQCSRPAPAPHPRGGTP
jgi:hypothetical protein